MPGDWPPGPDDLSGWERVLEHWPHLEPLFVEWLMGLPIGWTDLRNSVTASTACDSSATASSLPKPQAPSCNSSTKPSPTSHRSRPVTDAVLDALRYDVIVIDDPWSYANWTDAKNGAAVSAMTTQDEDFLSKVPVSKWAQKDCILLMWATWPKLDVALRVLDARGFEWVTAAPWIKTTPKSGDISTGIGFWFQSTSEVLIVARQGKPTTERFPILGLLTGDERQFYYPASRKHSRKPEDIYDWIEAKCGPPGDGTNGTTRYLELFATRERPGWTCIGSELGYWIDCDGISVIPPAAPEEDPPPPPDDEDALPPPPPEEDDGEPPPPPD